jgi:hypothetical protein
MLIMHVTDQALRALTVMAAHPARIPGPARAAAGLLLDLALILLLWGVVLAIAWDTAGPETILAVGGLALLVMTPLALLQERRQTRETLAHVPVRLIVPAAVKPLLDRLGLRELDVRRHPGAAPDRCLRRGRRAWIVVCGNTENHADSARFVLWHEVAHLARRDIARRRLRNLSFFGLYVGTAVSFEPVALAVAVLGSLVLVIGARWWAELACDRLAVRVCGPAVLHGWIADQREIRAAVERQGMKPARPLRQRMASRISHPPLALRAALHPCAPETTDELVAA